MNSLYTKVEIKLDRSEKGNENLRGVVLWWGAKSRLGEWGAKIESNAPEICTPLILHKPNAYYATGMQ